MRKLLVSLIALLAIALMPGAASATHSNGPGPDKDFISGSGKGPLPTILGTFPAHYEANGQSTTAVGGAATGHFFTVVCPSEDLNQPPCNNPLVQGLVPAALSGDVLCVTATGTGAVWRGVITQSNTPFAPVGFGVIGFWIDNGEGANDPPDTQFGQTTPPPGPNPACPSGVVVGGPNLQGNLVVHDGI